MTLRAPVHARTLETLVSIRDNADTFFFEFGEILWLRATHPSTGSVDEQGREIAAKFGVSIVPVTESQVFDLAMILDQVTSDYLWVLPGGSIVSVMTPIFLGVLLSKFQEESKLAFFWDGSYCAVYRVQALRALAAKGMPLTDAKDTAKRLHSLGFQCIVNNELSQPFAEIESIYGGMHNSTTDSEMGESLRTSSKRVPWWKRVFNRA